MSPNFPKPTVEAIRASLADCRPDLAAAPISYLAEGWDFWAFRAGDHVLRFPRRDNGVEALSLERRLLPSLAPTLPLTVPVPDLFFEKGPNDQPFIGHRFVAGVPFRELEHLPAAGCGETFGRFLRALHAFPVEKAAGLGVSVHDGPGLRRHRVAFYEDVIRQVFPLISCEARTFTERVSEAYLNGPVNFVFKPCLIHHDLDAPDHILFDANSGMLAGIIDFGDAAIGNPAIDFWTPLYELTPMGMADQLPDLLAAYGATAEAFERMRPELQFLRFRWPLMGILRGLELGDEIMVEEEIQALTQQCRPT